MPFIPEIDIPRVDLARQDLESKPNVLSVEGAFRAFAEDDFVDWMTATHWQGIVNELTGEESSPPANPPEEKVPSKMDDWIWVNLPDKPGFWAFYKGERDGFPYVYVPGWGGPSPVGRELLTGYVPELTDRLGDPMRIKTDFMPPHIPPTEIDRCYIYDIGLSLNMGIKPSREEENALAEMEKCWWREYVWVGDRWATREYFGCPCGVVLKVTR